MSRKGNELSPRLPADAHGKVSGSLLKKTVVASEAWKKSAAVNGKLQYVAHVHMEHVNSAGANNVL